jgi:hypothetical protein
MNNDDQNANLSSSDDEEPILPANSDDLLASDQLRLPADADILVRVHAVRSWLARRVRESELEIGQVALAQQMQDQTPGRRRQAGRDPRADEFQHALIAAQRHVAAYEEARDLLEDCVAHTTISDRLLVEYYLTLEDRMQASLSPTDSPWIESMQDVLQRVSQVGFSDEEDES